MHNSAQYSTTYFTVQVKSANRKVNVKLHAHALYTSVGFCAAITPTPLCRVLTADLTNQRCRRIPLWDAFLKNSANWLINWLLFIFYFIYFYLSFFHIRFLCIQDELSKATGLLLPHSFSYKHERLSCTLWTATTQNWNKSSTQIEHRAEAVGQEILVH